MMSAILQFSVRHKLAIILAALIGCGFGYWCLANMRMDAIPDLGETQVILVTHWDRSPDLVESQVTYPIVTALLGAPHVKTVRGISDFGSSYVYVIFDDNTDMYWARSRTMEYLSSVISRLPEGAKVDLGPDATSLGWIFQYVLVDTTGQHSLADLRSYQDWYLRYYLRSVPGVADVAPVGGFQRQYQVNLDPGKLQHYGISVTQVVDAVRGSNDDTSGRMIDFGGTEYMVRGRGYAKSLQDFRTTVVATAKPGTPVLVGDLGEVVLGPDLRRGVADLDGNGDVVSGVVIMRNGEDALQVIERVKAKLREIGPGLPRGVEIRPVYDRSELIHHTVSSVRWMIFEVMITVAVIILVFLWHAPSAITPLVIMPVAILLAFIPLHWLGVNLNVMSMAGIAIAIGELVDASVVIAEQIQKRLEQWERAGAQGSRSECVFAAVREVARPTFFALLVIAVAMLPVLTLEAQEGKMFRPLALAKLSAVLAAAVLTLTLDPALRLLIASLRPVRMRVAWLERGVNQILVGRVPSEEKNILSGLLHRLYAPVIPWVLRRRWWVLGGVAALTVVTVPVFLHLGSEYMPPMDEGAILYMPTTMPGISVDEAQRVLEATDRILMQFPEVDHVIAKAGRSENATDPAPLSMFETLITLRPSSQWRHVPTWYSRWAPQWLAGMLRHITPDTLSTGELVEEMNTALKVPGFTNAWTMPIKGRIDMLTSGVRTPLGLRITGADPKVLEEIGTRAAALLEGVRGTRGAFAEQSNLGHYIDVDWRRDQLARYGISVAAAQQVINSAIGGDNVTTVYSGPERYSVNVRYMRDFRGNLEALGRVLVMGAGGQLIPVRELATLQVRTGPSMLREEDGLLASYVYIDPAERDVESYVADAQRLLNANLVMPPGYTMSWAGQYTAMTRANRRLRLIIPVTVALVLMLIFLSTRSVVKTMIVMLAVPFSAIGAIWLLYFLHYNMSVAVWVGLLGLASIDAETGVFMLLYLDLAYAEAKRQNRLNCLEDLHRVIRYGAVKRLRPKFMTFSAACIGLLPIMWSTGAGADVLKRIAAPMVGGIFTSFLLELLVLPVVYEMWRRRSLPSAQEAWNVETSDAPLPAYAAVGQETAPGIG